MVVIGPGQPGLIAGKYQIERLIGKGGMAEVFAAVNVRTGKRVALKRINPALAATDEARARFKREALAAGRIDLTAGAAAGAQVLAAGVLRSAVRRGIASRHQHQK